MAREISQERLEKDVKRVLENPFWIQGLSYKTAYSRIHDDHDGTFDGEIGVYFTQDSDAWVEIAKKDGGALRFREGIIGGGSSPRVRNALMILAYAIKLDNEKHPQR
jgi:hypothetical protein